MGLYGDTSVPSLTSEGIWNPGGIKSYNADVSEGGKLEGMGVGPTPADFALALSRKRAQEKAFANATASRSNAALQSKLGADVSAGVSQQLGEAYGQEKGKESAQEAGNYAGYLTQLANNQLNRAVEEQRRAYKEGRMASDAWEGAISGALTAIAAIIAVV